MLQVPLDLLAIGDWWFEYPLYNEVLSFQNASAMLSKNTGERSTGADLPAQ